MSLGVGLVLLTWGTDRLSLRYLQATQTVPSIWCRTGETRPKLIRTIDIGIEAALLIPLEIRCQSRRSAFPSRE